MTNATGSAAGLESADAGSPADVEKSLFQLQHYARFELSIAHAHYGTPEGVRAFKEACSILDEIERRVQKG